MQLNFGALPVLGTGRSSKLWSQQVVIVITAKTRSKVHVAGCGSIAIAGVGGYNNKTCKIIILLIYICLF